MKNIVLWLCGMSMLLPSGNAQCNVNARELMKACCTGTYLMHYELDNEDAREASLILQGGNAYWIYLVNPSHSFSEYRILMENTDITGDFQTTENGMALKYDVIVDKTSEYHFKLRTGTMDQACILLAVYLNKEQDLYYKKGIYRNLGELKYNSPGLPLQYELKKVRISLFDDSYYYRMKTDREDRKVIGEIIGFSDGTRFYINHAADRWNFNYATQFVATEKIAHYLYFKSIEHMYVPTGSAGGIMMQTEYQKLLDLESGEVMILTKKRLREMIENDLQLLQDYENESRKSSKIRQYLIRYFERNPENQ